METSAAGLAFLERHEGVVLKAYRDPVGVWTIGCGLTAKSGIVQPRAGMAITRDHASNLLRLALNGNYEPSVHDAMPFARQHEFDAALSFHFNTGAIKRASWVRNWRQGNWDKVRDGLQLWVKGGGRVLPGLQRRRREEYELMAVGLYVSTGDVPDRSNGPTAYLAKIVAALTPDELARVRKGFASLGFNPGDDPRGITKQSVIAFQTAHDLTADGIVGRATLSTLQRALDARSKTAVGAGVSGGGAITGTTQLDDTLVAVPGLGWILLGIGALYLLYLAFHYRDALAARIQTILPRLAAALRSF
jgi:lysozyme